MRKVLVFAALVVVLDVALGAVLDRAFRRTLSGERGGLINFALRQSPQVLVLGSSRAQYQVDPKALEESLGLRTFNAGIEGHDFLYAALLFDLWHRSHPAPKAILLHVDLESFIERPNEAAAAQVFAPFVSDSARVREVLYGLGRFERVKYLSHAYRYNGKALPILKNLFARQDPAFDGFVALEGSYDPSRDGLPSDQIALSMARQKFSDQKIRYFDEMARWCAEHETRLFLIHSPVYGQSRTAHELWASRVRDLVARYSEAEFVDVSELTYPDPFARQLDLYKDYAHLNGRGAELFSSLLASELHKRMRARDDGLTVTLPPAAGGYSRVSATPVSARASEPALGDNYASSSVRSARQ